MNNKQYEYFVLKKHFRHRELIYSRIHQERINIRTQWILRPSLENRKYTTGLPTRVITSSERRSPFSRRD